MTRDRYPSRPGSGIFDPVWQFYHRPVAELQMTALCLIARPASASAGVYDPESGRTVFPPAVPLYTGPCRVQVEAQRSIAGVDVGDREAVKRRYAVCVPASVTDLQVDDQLIITTCEGDPSLVDRPLWISDITEGTLLWQRDLVCQELEPTTR